MPAPNINRCWADLLVEELARHGVRLFFLAPGSRSSPLVSAAAASKRVQTVVHFDERGAAFAALGAARASGVPAAWVTTSGTAVANGLPAVVEADADGVPLILLTADRPPELRWTGANQTVDQVKIFGDRVRWFFDFPTPTVAIKPEMVLATAAEAYARATGAADPGPVHLNLMFREPLAPTPDDSDASGYTARLRTWFDSDEPYVRLSGGAPVVDAVAAEEAVNELKTFERGAVVLGRMTARDARGAVALARRLGWPAVSDVLSQARFDPSGADVVVPGDLLLGAPGFSENHRAEAVLMLGSRPTSKAVLRWIADSALGVYTGVSPGPGRFDPDHRQRRRVRAPVGPWCEAAARALDGPKREAPWLKRWREVSGAVSAAVRQTLEESGGLTEPLAARIATQGAGRHGARLVLASSMPIRDADTYGASQRPPAQVLSNRGASGIDGTLATACGVSIATGDPVVLLIGDLALLHDLNSMAMARHLTGPLVVVAVNNDGGGIFSFLPVAESEPDFERHFAAPHGLTFEASAALFGLSYRLTRSASELETAVDEGLSCPGATLVEVPSSRAENVKVHRLLRESAAAAIGVGVGS